MASSCCSRKLLLLRLPIYRALKPNSSLTIKTSFLSTFTHKYLREPSSSLSKSYLSEVSRSFCSRSSPLHDASEGPAAIDYRLGGQRHLIPDVGGRWKVFHGISQEDEYHRLANATIHDLLDKLEEYGDSVDIDGFDVDYGNEVLTLKFGSLGTYVINKQTPNRQIWMSSPVRYAPIRSPLCSRNIFVAAVHQGSTGTKTLKVGSIGEPRQTCKRTLLAGDEDRLADEFV
ncbi:Frataxin, mitochondrial [Capsicum annuum]|nr:Frataxin, mitochondrial [Capsicum annuum]KAF3674732.1 Frataxin, mitochondrial [Capsicum annuum]